MYKPILVCAHLCERAAPGGCITPTSTITLSSSCTAVAPLTCGASSGFAAVGGRPVHWNAPLFTDCKATLGTLTSSATACRKVVAFSVQRSAFSVQRSAVSSVQQQWTQLYPDTAVSTVSCIQLFPANLAQGADRVAGAEGLGVNATDLNNRVTGWGLT